MKKNQRWIFLTTGLLICIAMTGIGRSSPATTVAVDPLKVEDLDPGESFTVDITVTDVNDLYGWSINLTFDPAVLNVANVTEGPFLQQFGITILIPGQTDNTKGFLTPGGILFDPSQVPPFPAEGATGSGILATITFTVEGRGEATLQFAETKLNTVIAGNNVPIAHEATDGLFRNAAPSALSIELIIGVAVAAAVAIAGIAVFFYMRRRT